MVEVAWLMFCQQLRRKWRRLRDEVPKKVYTTKRNCAANEFELPLTGG